MHTELRLREVQTQKIWARIYPDLKSGLAAMKSQNRQADLYGTTPGIMAQRVELIRVEVTVQSVVATGTYENSTVNQGA